MAQNSLKSMPPSPSWSTAPMMASTSAASAPGTPFSSAAATSARLMVPLPSASRLEKAWGHTETEAGVQAWLTLQKGSGYKESEAKAWCS